MEEMAKLTINFTIPNYKSLDQIVIQEINAAKNEMKM